ALTDRSGEQGGGGGIANLNITPLTGAPDSGVLTLTGSQVSGNSAAGLGGGILEDGVDMHDNLGQPGAPLTLQLSQVPGNSAGEGAASSPAPAARQPLASARYSATIRTTAPRRAPSRAAPASPATLSRRGPVLRAVGRPGLATVSQACPPVTG